MKIRLINYLNLILAIGLNILAIINFILGNIGIGIFDLVASGLNIFAFLNAVSIWWMYSKKVSDKFVFTCKKCGHQFIPSFWKWFFAPHLASRRYFKCEKCKKVSLMRRK
jgi:hypothetical protein